MIWAAALAATAGWLAFPTGRGVAARRSFVRSTWWHWSRQRPSQQRRVAHGRRQWVVQFAADVASEVRAGRPPEDAWRQLWRCGPARKTAGSLGSTHSIADIMRSASGQPGCHGLVRLAVCWEVAESSGAGLADALEKVAESLLAESEITDEIDGQLAGPRASVRLLVGLPLFALILGRSLGADPISVLVNTWYGWICLAAGLLLLTVGWRWSHAQVRSVTPWADQ